MGPPIYFEDLEVGAELPERRVTNSGDEVLDFLAVWTPEREGESRFSSEAVGKADGFPGAIVPGIQNLAHLGRTVTEWAPNVELRKLDVIYRGPVLHDQPLVCKGVVTDKGEVDGEPIVHVDLYMDAAGGGQRPLTANALVLVPRRVGSF